MSNCYDFNNILERDCTIYVSIWNKEDIDKEINVFLNCEKQIVRDINSIKNKTYLCNKCEASVIIKFEPIINLLTTKCNIEITKELNKIIEKEKKGNIRETVKKNKTDQNEYHLFNVKETENEDQTNDMKIIINSPIVFDINNKIEQHYLKNVDIIERKIYISSTYKQMFIIYATPKNIIITILLFTFFIVIIIPSSPFFKYIINMKLFHKLRINRVILFWKIQDIYEEIKWGLYICIKIGENVCRHLKIICLFILEKFSNFLKFRKVDDLVNRICDIRREEIVKRDSEKKIKYEKRKIDKQNLAKQRHKKLIEYEKLFLKELHKGHKRRIDEINEKKKKIKKPKRNKNPRN